MAGARPIKTSFTGGEASPRIEARSDLERYFTCCKTLVNFWPFVQGGVTARPGWRFLNESADSSKRSYLFRHIIDKSNAFVLEFGDQYIRFYKNSARLGAPYHLASPYLEADIPFLQLRGSVDVIYIYHQDYESRKLSHLGDTNWQLSTVHFDPPPSFVADADISGGAATLTPAATNGANIQFDTSVGVILAADVDRQIIFGASRAIITVVDLATRVHADILDNFPNVNPIPAGQWFLRGSPSTKLTPNKKDPVGASVTLTAVDDAFRQADVNAKKIVKINDGVIQLNLFTNAKSVKGTIKRVLSTKAQADEGTWRLEDLSFSAAFGYPRAGEFLQGRNGVSGTKAQPTAWWLSAADSYENFATGKSAADAVAYTIAAREYNAINWLVDNGPLLIGTGSDEIRAKGPGVDTPLGGDIVPDVRTQDEFGSLPIMPVKTPNGIIFVDATGRKIIALAYSSDVDRYQGTDLTRVAEHITKPAIAQGQIAYTKSPDPRLYFVRSDGQGLCLVYEPAEKVLAFSRMITQGEIESFAAIPHPDGDRYQLWVQVKVTLPSGVKRYIGYFDDKAPEFAARAWQELKLDCAKVYTGAAVTNVPVGFLDHLEGMTVGVVADSADRGDRLVVGGRFDEDLQEAATKIEVGLRFTPELTTMRPAIAGVNIEGLNKRWTKLFVRLLNSWGCEINGKQPLFPTGGQPMDQVALFTGDKDILSLGWDEDQRVTIRQPQAYPLTVLAIFGRLQIEDPLG